MIAISTESLVSNTQVLTVYNHYPISRVWQVDNNALYLNSYAINDSTNLNTTDTT